MSLSDDAAAHGTINDSLREPPSRTGTDSSVSLFATPWQRILDEAKLYWPRNTAKKLAKLTGKSPRTCYRWYARKRRQAPDAADLLAIVAAMRADWTERGKIFQQFEFDLQ